MKLELIPEPDLEFGAGNHIDIRFGIRDYGPIGFDNPLVTRTIRIGFVGTAGTIQGIRAWMHLARSGVAETLSKKPKFRPAFPGFGVESPFRCDWASEPRLERALDMKQITSIATTASRNDAVRKAVDCFIEECRYLESAAKVDVIICAPSVEMLKQFDSEDDRDEEDDKADRSESSAAARRRKTNNRQVGDLDFHDYLKAQSLTLSSPVQFVRPRTYDASAREISVGGRVRKLQDPATRAWNFHTALYYKAGGTPWRLLRRTSDLESVYVGVSFFRTIDYEHIHTSVAQVFNERGEGMILQGSEAKMSKDDLQPHLEKNDMKILVERALKAFEKEHHHLPPRVVIHKTSGFTGDEIAGCEAALETLHIRHRDLLVVRESDVRLFRFGTYPPLRGTFLELDDKHCILYTRGSIPFFEMYPGQYVPRALEIESVATEQPARQLAGELLALTKMNWNNTQFDAAQPITVRAARQVGNILKYASDLKNIQSRYAFYM